SAEVRFKEAKVLHDATVLRDVVNHVGYGLKPPYAVCGNDCQSKCSYVDGRAVAMHKNVDCLQKASHQREVQVTKVSRCRWWQPCKHAGNHHKAHEKQRHNVEPRYNPKLAKDENVRTEKREEPDGYRQIRKKRCQSHSQHHRPDSLLLILCSRKLDVILVEKVNRI